MKKQMFLTALLCSLLTIPSWSEDFPVQLVLKVPVEISIPTQLVYQGRNKTVSSVTVICSLANSRGRSIGSSYGWTLNTASNGFFRYNDTIRLTYRNIHNVNNARQCNCYARATLDDDTQLHINADIDGYIDEGSSSLTYTFPSN
jgi:hypothetical protein